MTGLLGNDKCPHCEALLFEGEKSNECCMYGDVHCEPLPDSPRLIVDLCDRVNIASEAKEFRDNIIGYNTALSFGSLSAGSQMPPGRGPPVVMLNGQQSQQIGNVRPGVDEHGHQKDPLFGQVYVFDDLDAATDARIRTLRNRALRRGTVRSLEAMMRELNPYARRLATLGQQLDRANRGEETGLPPPQHFRLSILDNRPAPGQVFALFDERENNPPDPSRAGIWNWQQFAENCHLEPKCRLDLISTNVSRGDADFRERHPAKLQSTRWSGVAGERRCNARHCRQRPAGHSSECTAYSTTC